MKHSIRLLLPAAVLAVFTIEASAQLTWTKQPIGTTSTLQSVAASGGNVFSAATSSEKILRSEGGQMWGSAPQRVGTLDCIVFGNNVFVGVSRNFSPAGSSYIPRDIPGAAYSATGGTYTQSLSLSSESQFLADISFGNGTFAVIAPYVDAGASKDHLFRSTDGKVWTTTNFTLPRMNNFEINAYRIALGGGALVVFAQTYGGSPDTQSGLFSSVDGTTWTLRIDLKGATLDFITYANGQYVAVGRNGAIYTSPDGTSWTSRASGTIAHLKGVAFGKGMWVAVGVSGVVRVSSDNGVTWATSNAVTFEDLNSVAFGNNTFVAVGEGGLILQSN